MDTSVINRDLVRWTGRHWFWCVFAVLGFQLAVLFYAANPLQVRTTYPSEPVLQLASRGATLSSTHWLELEDPMLFAAPNWRNVSGLAWLRQPELELAGPPEFPPIQFLAYHQARQINSGTSPDTAILISKHRRPPAEPLLPVLPPPAAAPRSVLALQGFDHRQPLTIPELPNPLHSDVVGRTIVQAAIDPEGAVLSARVITSSGAKQADASALEITRKLRFQPLPGAEPPESEISWGKLIFQWHALDLGSAKAARQ